MSSGEHPSEAEYYGVINPHTAPDEAVTIARMGPDLAVFDTPEEAADAEEHLTHESGNDDLYSARIIIEPVGDP